MAFTNIFGLIKSIVKENRANEAEDWPLADATVSRFTTEPEVGGLIRPVVVFTYAVNGETFYGSCTGYPVSDTSHKTLKSAITAISTLRIRFDPVDPGMSRTLNSDNPGLPFEIDHAPYE
jgi:hypothetical protein